MMMKRRLFIKALATAVASLSVTTKAHSLSYSHAIGKLLQTSPLAGFQYYSGQALWEQLAIGQALTLKREPDNAYDKRAVAVYWQEKKLGFLPKMENTAISQLLDRGEKVHAYIANMQVSDNPWSRLRLEVRWDV
ncbi:MAG: HIRAN domain-containing protein [Methylophilus sp.]|jgi:hypothetical protein